MSKRSMFVPHERHGFVTVGDSKTRQEFAAECDINTIMARYAKTGVINHFAPRQPMYIDFEEVPDFMSAMNTLIVAEQAFMRLPATVRREFDNDPRKFVEFAENKDNLGKLREWGLAKPLDPEPAPMRVEVVAPPAPPAAPGGAS